MGFFSWNCKCCGHPALCPQATNDVNQWMSNVVAVTKNGSVIKGEYDGYGRIDGHDLEEPVDIYHQTCWKWAGKPRTFTGGSESARDQGWFFDKEHDMPEPHGPTPKNLWADDKVQFARVIAEAEAAGAFTNDIKQAMSDSMDLTKHEIDELIDRAQTYFDELKAKL